MKKLLSLNTVELYDRLEKHRMNKRLTIVEYEYLFIIEVFFFFFFDIR